MFLQQYSLIKIKSSFRLPEMVTAKIIKFYLKLVNLI